MLDLVGQLFFEIVKNLLIVCIQAAIDDYDRVIPLNGILNRVACIIGRPLTSSTKRISVDGCQLAGRLELVVQYLVQTTVSLQ
jgi:hypothetical protein